MKRFMHIAFILLAFCLVLSCKKTVDYGGCPQNGISYSEINNQLKEPVEVKIYHLINDNNHILLTLNPNSKQMINYDMTTCDSLVVFSNISNKEIVLYGSRQEQKDPQIGTLCDWHHDKQKVWISLPITNSLINK